MSRTLNCVLAVSAFAALLAPPAAQAREERLIGQIVGMVVYEEETPDGLLQVYEYFGDFSRLGAFRSYGAQLVGPQGEIAWGFVVLARADRESYLWYAAERLSDNRLDGWFYLDGYTLYPDYYGYGALAGTDEPRLRLAFDGILVIPD